MKTNQFYLLKKYAFFLAVSCIPGILCLVLLISCYLLPEHIPGLIQILAWAGTIAFLGILLFFLFWLYPDTRKYQQLFTDFADGRVYDAFIQQSTRISPDIGRAIHRLDDLIDRQNSLQLSTKQAEFLALQNQINPHFLYNTLESIRGDALLAGMTNIADITEALSTFFRYTITNTQNLVTIQDELDNVENYFIIQHYRFGEKLSLQIDIPQNRSEILAMSCPKLFLQPVVENAIFHGLEKKSVNGQITIRMELADDLLLISISDNGAGMPEEVLHRLNSDLDRVSVGSITTPANKKGGIALKNVCRRIKLLFGEEYGMHVGSIVGLGTKVEVRLPITQKTGRTS